MSEPTRAELEHGLAVCRDAVAKGDYEPDALAVAKYEIPIFVLALEALDRRAQTCASCKHSFIPASVHAPDQANRRCKRTKQTTGEFTANYIRCADLGNGCNAHVPKEAE